MTISSSSSSSLLLLLLLLVISLLVIVKSTPSAPNPKETKELIKTVGLDLLAKTGSSYGVDLRSQDFEISFAKKMAEGDKDLLSLTITGSHKNSPKLYKELRDVLIQRFCNLKIGDISYKYGQGSCEITEIKTINIVLEPEEASIWFFLAGHANTLSETTDVDNQIRELLNLAEKAVKGIPFYPRQVVVDLMNTAVEKLHKNLAPLVLNVGNLILKKARHLALRNIGKPLDDPLDINIPAEFFQFWQELCQFCSKYASFDDVLTKPLTLYKKKDEATITMKNLISEGGPLTLEQLDDLLGFLNFQIKATSINSILKQQADPSPIITTTCAESEDDFDGRMICTNESIAIGPHILEQTSRRYETGTKDARYFFIGYCGMTETKTAININLGHRHAKAPLKFAQFQFLVDIFRGLNSHVDMSMSGRDANHNKEPDPKESIWVMEIPENADVVSLSSELEPEIKESSPFRLDDEYLEEDGEGVLDGDDYGDE